MIHNLDPVLIDLGLLQIRWYSLAYIVGFLFSWIYIKRLSLSRSLYDRKSNFDSKLVDDLLKLDNGNEVQISKCPNEHGKIKSPMCCGDDMSCPTM